MDPLFDDFKSSYEQMNGYDLSMTLSPISPPSQPERLHSFFRSTNIASVKSDFKYRVLYEKPNRLNLEPEEGNGWVDLYFAYWKAVGEILKAEAAARTNTKVGTSSGPILLLFTDR